MTDTITPAAHAMAKKLIKEFEGLRLTAYPDPATGGDPWTIGWGTTAYPSGERVEKGDKISEVFAEQCLDNDMRKFENGIGQHVIKQLTDAQNAALISFAYNLGLGNLYHSTLLTKVNNGDWDGAAAEFGKWVHAGGKILQGLVRRRSVEAKLFLAGSKVA